MTNGQRFGNISSKILNKHCLKKRELFLEKGVFQQYINIPKNDFQENVFF